MFKRMGVILTVLMIFLVAGCDNEVNGSTEKIDGSRFKYKINCFEVTYNLTARFYTDDYDYKDDKLSFSYFDKSAERTVKINYLNPRCVIVPNFDKLSGEEKEEYETLYGSGTPNYILTCRDILRDGKSKFYVNKFAFNGKELAVVDTESKKMYKLIDPICMAKEV